MAKIPEYQRVVEPGGYRGPTALETLQTGLTKGQRTGAIASAAADALANTITGIAGSYVDFRVKAKLAYDNAQLAKAEMTYWSLLKKASDIDIPNSGAPLGEWDEMYQKAEEEAYEAAMKHLEKAGTTFIFGGPDQATVLDTFEAYRAQQSVTFQAELNVKQTNGLQDEAKAAMMMQIRMLRDNPGYLETAVENIDRLVASTPGFSKESAEKLKEDARQVARYGLYNKQFEEMVKSVGIYEALKWFSNPLNTPEMSDQERSNLLQDLSNKANGIKSAAENFLDQKLSTIYDDMTIRYYNPKDGKLLTKDDVIKAYGGTQDPNAPQGSSRADREREHWLQMINSRDAGGIGSDPSKESNAQLKNTLYLAIQYKCGVYYDEKTGLYELNRGLTKSDAQLEEMIRTYTGARNGVPRLNATDSEWLQDERESKTTNTNITDSMSLIDKAVSSGFATPKEAAEIRDVLIQAEQDYRAMEAARPGKVPPIDNKWYADTIQAWLNTLYMQKGKTTGGPAKMTPKMDQFMKEASQTGFYYQRGTAGRRNIEQMSALCFDQQMKGMTRIPAWQKIYDAADAEWGNMLLGRMTQQPNLRDAKYTAVDGAPGFNEFIYKNPKDQKDYKIYSYRDMDGYVVYLFEEPVRDWGQAPVGVTGLANIPGIEKAMEGWTPTTETVYVVPWHNQKTDTIEWALYDPLSKSFAIDPVTKNPQSYDFKTFVPKVTPKPAPAGSVGIPLTAEQQAEQERRAAEERAKAALDERTRSILPNLKD